MLEEIGHPYRLHLLPFPPRRKSPEYLEINPLGTIPYLVTGGAGMTESAAIIEYLAGQYADGEFAVAPDAANYPLYLNFLHMGEATLTFPQTLYLRYSQLEPDDRKNPQIAEDYKRWFLSRLGVALSMLEGEFACGEQFTAADISVGYAIKLAKSIGLASALPVAANDYFDRLSNRPAYRRALAAERP